MAIKCMCGHSMQYSEGTELTCGNCGKTYTEIQIDRENGKHIALIYSDGQNLYKTCFDMSTDPVEKVIIPIDEKNVPYGKADDDIILPKAKTGFRYKALEEFTAQEVQELCDKYIK